MKLWFVISMIALASFSFGYVIHMVTPVNTYLEPLKPSLVSPVGPGYKVILAFDRDTKSGFVWDNLVCTTNTTWALDYAKDHKFLYAFIYVPKDAREGDYTFSFTISDANGDHIQENAMVTLHVTRNPEDLAEIFPMEDRTLTAGNDFVQFRLRNKALGEARYLVDYWVPGVGSWKKEVVIPPGKEEVIRLNVTIPTEGYYTVYAKVLSQDTPIIRFEINKTFYVRPTIHSKISSIMEGIPVVPITLSPVYTLLGIISVFW